MICVERSQVPKQGSHSHRATGICLSPTAVLPRPVLLLPFALPVPQSKCLKTTWKQKGGIFLLFGSKFGVCVCVCVQSAYSPANNKCKIATN